MRKVFWGCTACAVLFGVAVLAAANHAARYPHSLIGRVLHGASHLAARLNPVAGFGPVLARMERSGSDVIASVEGIPDEPEAVPEAPPEPVDNAEPIKGPESEEPPAAPIVIPDDDRAGLADAGVPMPASVEPVPVPVPQALPFAPETECPPPAVCQGAPATMPPCRDEEECEPLPIFTEEGCELLPMPACEEEVQECPDTALHHGVRLKEIHVKVLEALPPDGKKTGECREDPNREQHAPGCPATGCPGMKHSPCVPPTQAASPGGEESSEPPSKSALRTIRRFKMRQPLDETVPVHPEVDTMEFRPSDGQLYDYGPGAL
jgi:hypothetical protein